jgi:hypothetical protein
VKLGMVFVMILEKGDIVTGRGADELGGGGGYNCRGNE